MMAVQYSTRLECIGSSDWQAVTTIRDTRSRGQIQVTLPLNRREAAQVFDALTDQLEQAVQQGLEQAERQLVERFGEDDDEEVL